MVEWLLPVVAACMSALLTAGYRRFALARAFLDIPNDRSSHEKATPRGGGVSIALAFTVTAALLWLTGRMSVNVFVALAVGGGVVAAIGLLDDLTNVRSSARILVHFAVAFWALFWLGGVPPVPVGEFAVDAGILGYFLGALLLVWLLNLYNFMDGIDGIASVETLTVTGFASIHLSLAGMPGMALWPACLAGATAGFAVWNWPPARIFMGDAGSGFLGYAIGAIALATTSSGSMTVWTWIILLGVFLSDASVTLLRRVVHETRWYAPHRSHAYQRVSRRWKSHKKVTLAVFGVNVAWLWPMAFASELHREAGWWLALVALAPLVGLALLAGAGKAEQTNETVS